MYRLKPDQEKMAPQDLSNAVYEDELYESCYKIQKRHAHENRLTHDCRERIGFNLESLLQ